MGRMVIFFGDFSDEKSPKEIIPILTILTLSYHPVNRCPTIAFDYLLCDAKLWVSELALL